MGHFIGTPLDAAVIIGYFVLVLIFGSVFGRFTKTTKDFFFGGQRFSWWLIAMSCVATVVGSYSFIKYSAASYRYGGCSTMTYLNDWFIMPFFIFGWLPIIYFARVSSIPEYFERRFDKTARGLATFFIMLYILGYIGINFYTLGRAMEGLMGIDLYTGVIAIAVVSAIYVTAGGQTAVIMTDLLQGFLLLIAGFVLLFLGIQYVGGWSQFWHSLPPHYRQPFSGLTTPAKFPGVGIFWQDAMANSIAFYFMNQGVIMRFLSVKSVKEGRKAIMVVALVLMPLATLAIANAGWLAKSMVALGLLPADINADTVFVVAAKQICRPGVFGLIMAALTAALMSTVDTLINAISAIFVNDIWRPYLRPNMPDKHYLFTARWFSILATLAGVLLVPVFKASGTIYEAHGMFTAAITPPMVITILLGAFWKRYHARAAIVTLVGGGVGILLSFVFPHEILGLPIFSWGMGPAGFKFIRAFYGLSLCLVLGVGAAWLLPTAGAKDLTGLVAGTIREAAQRYKGAPLGKTGTGQKVTAHIELADLAEGEVRLWPQAMDTMGAVPGDLLYVTDHRWWLGGLRSMHCKAGPPHEQVGKILLGAASLEQANLLPERPVRVEKIM